MIHSQFPQTRLRRRRMNPSIRHMLAETILHPKDFVLPLFIHHKPDTYQEIPSMPGQYQLGLDHLPKMIHTLQSYGIGSVILFGIPEYKDALGSTAHASNSIIAKAIQSIKEIAPNLCVIADVCLCEYTDHGHCGIISESKTILNDETLEQLSKQALCFAKAGVDIVAPSGMMDGMVKAIRKSLDQSSFQDLPILSYSTKYASCLYGPFRDAAEGTPKFGDRKSHQTDPANLKEALLEHALDIQEGADRLMVKPATFYLDVIRATKDQFPEMPLFAYQVSGEYAMMKAAIEKGWLSEQVIMESLISMKRAGADILITYFALDAIRWLKTYSLP